MQKSIDDWVKEFQEKDIPVLSKTADDLAILSMQSDKLTPPEIARVIYRDPLMTLKVLRFVNRMHRGRLAGEITTVEHAIMMLGINPFFNQFKQFSSIEDQLGQNKNAFTHLMQVISRAHHAAYQAWDWAILRNDVKAEEIYTGALLQSLGEQVFWCFAPETAMAMVHSMQEKKWHFVEAQKEVLGFELSDFQMALGNAWNLPELYVDFMDPRNAERPRVIEIRLADAIARRADRGWHQESLHSDMKEIAALLRMSEDAIVSRIHHNAVVAAEQWPLYGVTPAAAWLPMLPGEWPDESLPDKTPPAANASTGGLICPVPQQEVMTSVMNEIKAHLDSTFNLQQLMALVLKGMHDGIGLDRVVFALLTPDHSMVKAKFVLGAEADSPLRQFEFSLGSPHLFTRMMGKMQGIWLNASNQEKFDPLLSPEIKRMIGEGEFFAMSVHVHEKPVGFFYADRKRGPCALDEHSYDEFKALCLRAAQGLAHLAKK